MQMRLDEKRRRKEFRGEKRRIAQLNKLREQINASFIETGEAKTNMVYQEFANVHGFYQKRKISNLIVMGFVE